MQAALPIKIKRKAINSQYKVDSEGNQTVWKCPYCSHEGLNKKHTEQHIRKKHLVQKEEMRVNEVEQKLKYNQLFNRFEIQQKQLEKLKIQFNIIHQKVITYQTHQHEAIISIVNEIMIDSSLFISLLRLNVYQQVKQLRRKNFKAVDIINKSKQLISDKIKLITFASQFSQFEENMELVKKKCIIQRSVSNQYRSRLISGWKFLKKYKENEFKYPYKLINDISMQQFHQRKIIYRVYRFMIEDYSDKFGYNRLPKRLITKQRGIKLQRPKVTMQAIRKTMQQLYSQNNYVLAVDFWFCCCMGLRSRQLKKLFFIDDNGNYIDVIKVWEYKNNHYTIRVVPSSLKQMISKHGILYPITQVRWKKLVEFCLTKLRSFYGLRSLFITSLIKSIVMQNRLAEIHQDVQTTIQFYVNQENKELINSIFQFNDYKFQYSKKILIIHHDGHQIIDEDILEMKKYNVQTSINTILNNTQLDAVAFESELESEQLKILQNQLRQGLEVTQSKFSSIQQILQQQGQDPEQILSNIANDCQVQINFLQVNQKQKPALVRSYGDFQDRSVNIIKQNYNNGTSLYRMDETNILRQEFLQINRSVKRKKMVLSQNWPLLKRKILCTKCKITFQTRQCKNHFSIYCSGCNYQYHKCELQSGNLCLQKIYCDSYIETDICLQALSSSSENNNIKQIIQKDGRELLNRIYFKDSTPGITCKFPKFSESMRRKLESVRQNQHKLPLQIRKTKRRGYGVFAKQLIKQKSIVCAYNGVIVRNQATNKQDDSMIQIGMVKDQSDIFNLSLDASKHCNVGRYLNSCSQPKSKRRNCEITMGLMEYQNQIEMVIFLYSIREIKSKQELIWWYGVDYWSNKNFQPESDDDEQISQQEQVSEQEIEVKPKKKVKLTKLDHNNNIEMDYDFNDIKFAPQSNKELDNKIRQQPKAKVFNKINLSQLSNQNLISKIPQFFEQKPEKSKGIIIENQDDIQKELDALSPDDNKKFNQKQVNDNIIEVRHTSQKERNSELEPQIMEKQGKKEMNQNEQGEQLQNKQISSIQQLKSNYHDLQSESLKVKELSDKIQKQLQMQVLKQVSMQKEKKNASINIQLKNEVQIKAFGIYFEHNSITNNETLKLEIASIVKLLVVKVALNLIQQNGGLQTKITLQKYSHTGTTAWLVAGKSYSLTQLIQAALISSACEASYNIALYFGKMNSKLNFNSECINYFIELMQEEAKKIGMKDTKVQDVTGLGKTQSTIADLKILIQWVKENDFVKQILQTSSIIIERTIENTNWFLPLKIYGKTGTGERALSCFAGYKDQYIFILLGAFQKQILGTKIEGLIKKMKSQIKKKK